MAQAPPSRPVRQADGQLVADDPIEPTQWSLDALVSAAHQQGIAIKRSQVRRVLLKEKVRWRQVRSWAVSKDPDFVPKGRRRVEAYTHPEAGSTTLCVDELGPVCARSFAPAPGRSVDGHRIKAPLEYSRGLEKTWVYGALYVRDGQALTLSAPSRNTAGYLQLLEAIEQAYPGVKLTLIGDNREQPQEPAHSSVVSRAPAHPATLHSGQGRLAQFDGTLVAVVAAGSFCRTVFC